MSTFRTTTCRKLIVCQSLSVAVGITYEQFTHFMQQGEEQVSMVILEARANDLLFMGDEEEIRWRRASADAALILAVP